MFDNRLIILREELNLSKREAAEKLNLPYTTYSNYENDEREPNSEMLIKISQFYNVSVDFLLGLTPIRKKENEHMCEVLGLSEKSIEHLKEMATYRFDEPQKKNYQLTEAIDFLLKNDKYNELISTLSRYYAIIRYDNEIKRPIPKEVDELIHKCMNTLPKYHFELVGTFDYARMCFEEVMQLIRKIYTEDLFEEMRKEAQAKKEKNK